MLIYYTKLSTLVIKLAIINFRNNYSELCAKFHLTMIPHLLLQGLAEDLQMIWLSNII